MNIITISITFLACIGLCSPSYAQNYQYEAEGIITNTDGEPIIGVSISVNEQDVSIITDKKGRFIMLTNRRSNNIKISHIGYETKRMTIELPSKSELVIILHQKATEIQEVVVSTGYYNIPKERVTGSFVTLDSALLNRSISSDLITRLEGITNGLYFDRRFEGYSNSPYSLRVRGVSSINNDRGPLIVVDNFPYEGNIDLINPNDIENVTVLKDAGAASIWGAKAGNGVIVINTKQGKYNEPFSVSFNSSLSFKEKADLYYNPNFLSSKSFLEVERELFNRGYYAENDWNALSPVVELLIDRREGRMSETALNNEIERLGQIDVRDALGEYLYQNPIVNQYSIRFNGGAQKFNYYLSGGYDESVGSRKGDKSDRITLSSVSNYKPFENLEISVGLNYRMNNSISNSLTETSIAPAGKSWIYPYAELANASGKALPIVKNYRSTYVNQAETSGLANWEYKPLEELGLNDYRNKNQEVTLNLNLNYRIIKGLTMGLKYQYQKGTGEQRSINYEGSYEARDIVNRFTQSDGELIVPEGGIYLGYNSERIAKSLRSQLNYQFNRGDYKFTMLGGAEVRRSDFLKGPGFRLLGYDQKYQSGENGFEYQTRYPVRPRGSRRIPAPPSSIDDLSDRFVSYYGNLSSAFKDRYIFTSSIRWDASNLFGVRTNQKGVPLWSVGAKWDMSNEEFYQIEWLPQLNLRATFGYNGNLDKSLTAFTIAKYSTDNLTRLRNAKVITPGNDALRWEKVKTFNLGLDYSFREAHLSGTIEYYQKHATDLINDTFLEPTIGFPGTYKVNYASLVTKGIDAEIHSAYTIGKVEWKSSLLVNYTKNKVTEQDDLPLPGILRFADYPRHARKGYSLDVFYSLPWYGLNADGDPIVRKNGEDGKAYGAYIADLTLDDMIYSGITVPPLTSYFLNTFTLNRFSFSFNLVWKSGHKFRRNSIEYVSLFNNWVGHSDFDKRWKVPGDEKRINIPSFPDSSIPYRDEIYTKSEILVEKADNLRLQDVSLGYAFGSILNRNIKDMRVFFYARNLGVLWKATQSKIDPDYPLATVLPSKSFSLGLKFSL